MTKELLRNSDKNITDYINNSDGTAVNWSYVSSFKIILMGNNTTVEPDVDISTNGQYTYRLEESFTRINSFVSVSFELAFVNSNYSDGFENVRRNIYNANISDEIDNSNVAGGETVTLNTIVVASEFTVTFTVSDSNGVVENARININSETLTTNASGQATIDLETGTYAYAVSKDGYFDSSGSVTVNFIDVSESVTISETTYTLDFNVFDASLDPIANATILIDGNTLTTDATGHASVQLLNGIYVYTVNATDYQEKTDSVTVASEDKAVNVKMFSIPLQDNSIVYLDGTIQEIEGSKYFIDKTNGYNFLINNYDFTDDWISGFPYKSAATISAPVGNTTLIANDINNFLYDSGGTPNEIPVISLSKDIDYEHKIFTKHVAQVLDVNGVEIQEPYVSEIVMYREVLSGSDLTTANDYYGVPNIVIDALWAAYDGNDITGDGTEANPYNTLSKLQTESSSLGVSYYKSQIETLSEEVVQKAGQTISTGLAKLIDGGTPTNILIELNDNLAISGFIIDQNNDAAFGLKSYTDSGIVVDKCLFINSNRNAIRLDTINNTIQNCIFTGGSQNDLEIRSSIKIDGCIFTGTINSVNRLITLFGSSVEKSYFKNNKVSTQVDFVINWTLNGDLDISGNYVKPIIENSLLTTNTATESCVLNIYNNELVKSTILCIYPNATIPISIYNNKISEIEQTAIRLDSESFTDINIYNNIINGENTEETSRSSLFTDNSDIGSLNVYSNYMVAKYYQGYGIYIGDQLNDSSYPVVIEKNTIIGRGANPSLSTSDINHSIIFNWRNSNFITRYNYIAYGMLAITYKGLGLTPTKSDIIYNVSKSQLLSKGVRNVKFYGNTVIIDQNNVDDGLIRIMNNNNTLEDASGCVVKNNILINVTDTQFYSVNLLNAESIVDFECDYNIYYSANNDVTFNYAGVDKTFAQWQALGYDTHSIVLTDEQFAALFTDFDNNDFSLKTGSVAIGAGENLGVNYIDGLDASTDWGNVSTLPVIVTKQQTAPWDIGAYVS